jgi:hypothetical protein
MAHPAELRGMNGIHQNTCSSGSVEEIKISYDRQHRARPFAKTAKERGTLFLIGAGRSKAWAIRESRNRPTLAKSARMGHPGFMVGFR